MQFDAERGTQSSVVAGRRVSYHIQNFAWTAARAHPTPVVPLSTTNFRRADFSDITEILEDLYGRNYLELSATCRISCG